MSVIWLPYYEPSRPPFRYRQGMSNYEFLRRLNAQEG